MVQLWYAEQHGLLLCFGCHDPTYWSPGPFCYAELCANCAVGGKQEVDRQTAVGMCQTTWKIVLNALSQLLARSSSEEIILHLLKVGC